MLQATRLNVTLADTHILHDICCTIDSGEWIGLLGPNGSGKTTFLRAVDGVIPYKGSLSLDGQEVRAWSPRRLARRMAFVRQDTSISFDFTVREVVLLGRSPYKGWLSPYTSHDRKQVQTALEQLDLDGFGGRLVTSLSGGERQLVFLAQALVQEADILLLDEPTNHLDIHHQYQFLHQVQQLVEHGHTVVTAFHDLNLAARYADRLFVLDEGRLAAQGPPEEILTEDLIASVFRVNARIDQTDEDGLNIRFLAPL